MLYVYDRVYETLKLTKNVSKCTGWQTFSRSERLDGISLKKLHEDKREVCREGGGGGGQWDPCPLLSTPLIRLTLYIIIFGTYNQYNELLCTFN